ncbi:unnamed protein product [Calypogeia fissa]
MGDENGQQQRRQFWLLKTEPHVWSWQNQEENSGMSVWDGVRNAQAQKHMRSMSVDDLCLFYHTGKAKEVVGVVRVVRTIYPDPTDDSGKWGAVDVREVEALKQAVTLAQMKDDDHFKGFLMLRQPRLSVVPIDEHIWERVCKLGGIDSAKVVKQVEKEKTGKSVRGGSVKKEKKAAEVKGQKAGTKEKTIPKSAARASTRKSRESIAETTDKGVEEKQTRRGRKRGAEEANDPPKKITRASYNNGYEVEEAVAGSRTPKTRKRKPA